MESDDNVSGEFQRSTRMPLEAVVRLHFQGTVAYQNGFAANVSATGMFVKHPAPPPLGTQLVFEFHIGAARKPVQGAGEVVWVRERYLGPGQPAGVGVHFLQLDTQSRDHVAEALFEYLEQSLGDNSLLDDSGMSYGSATPAAEAAAPKAAAVGAPFADPGASGTVRIEVPAGLAGSAAVAAPTAAQPFDLASLEKLPQRSALAVPPEAKRPFSVFSPLDEADPQTADIVREALRDEPPLPSIAAAAAVSARPGSPWRMVLLILALAGAAGTFAWYQWGSKVRAGRSGSATGALASPTEPAPVSPPAGRRPEPLAAAPAPGTTLVQEVGIDPRALSPAAAQPRSGATTAPPEEPSDVAVAAADAAGAPAEARPEQLPVPQNLARARRLLGIDWNESGEPPGQTTLMLAGDAAFATGSFSYSEIGGENPRVLIKLKNMENPYRGPAPHGGGGLVRGVRTGFHVTTTGNEIHVVVDLARSGVRVVSLAPSGSDGSALTLRLAL